MSVQFLVKRIETCPKCLGKKVVQNPLWEEFWAKHSLEAPPSDEEMKKWFRENGYGNALEMRIDGLPDEEQICGECEGEGKIVSEVELLDAINELANQEGQP